MIGTLCLDLARAVLAPYVHLRSDEDRLASRIRIGIEDDIEDLVRDGKILKKGVLACGSSASEPPAPAPGSASLGERGEAGAATRGTA